MNNPTKNLVRDFTFLCPQCHVWSYRCLTCQQESAWLHQRECAHLPNLLDHCCHRQASAVIEEEEEESGDFKMNNSSSIGIPTHKALLVFRAALQKQNPKPEIQQQWQELMELETHLQDHHQQQQQSKNKPSYLLQAREFSQWMLDNGLFGGGAMMPMAVVATTNVTMTVQELVHIFLAINANAIGLGENAAVGLFPCMSSMFNHSCNENVTHSWHAISGMLQFRAVETILSSTGDGIDGDARQQQESCISYVSKLQESTQERTASLAIYKFFTCSCP
jgi:SET domain